MQLFIDELDPTNAAAAADAAAAPASADWDAPPTGAPPPSGAPSGLGSVPIRQQRARAAAAQRAGNLPTGGGATGMQYEGNTIDESDWASLSREAGAITRNLKLVCNPMIKESEVEAMLQHWDMWGPLVRALPLPVHPFLGARLLNCELWEPLVRALPLPVFLSLIASFPWSTLVEL